MAGLLDFINTPAGQGLLAAGFGALAGRGSRTQAIGQGGLLGLQAYSGAQDQIEQRKKQAVAEQMQQMQLQQVQQQMAQQQQKGNYLQSVGRVTSPVVGAKPNEFDPMKYVGLGGSPTEAQALANSGNWGKASVKDYKEVRTPDGGVQIVGFDEYGNQVKTGATPFKAPEVRDFGGYVGGIDPITGKVQQYGNKTMSAAERDASSRGWANVNLDRAKHSYAQQRDAIDRKDKLTGAVGEKLTEGEGKATLYLGQMRSASRNLQDIEKSGKTPSPLSVSMSGGYTNVLAGETAQKVAQAQNQWSEAYLRQKTGAAATAEEIALNRETFFPRVGDSKGVKEQKAMMRQQAEQDMLAPVGRGARMLNSTQQGNAKFLGFE
jgi:hypothetical protein